ncbi:potassium-transporting ATPase subunit KdpA [Kitasatospora phosalacinea]|uniref:Potassium-transporting ATPase potassium-binding subunit n=1 Tax=Kitasatospora phosalacinea TaxID=2065 RepID=A0A9W6PP41_9ACTN|nr:potassium-transporting ATPase subunit KdpA [Kitasatospora phosalacinea]GLW58336.1 potassium-transporting ATPase potassium-binding subunit [Kitasatospora phosalacinea]
MGATPAGWLQAIALVGALALCHRPLGDHIAGLLTSARHLRAEKALYKAVGVDADADQRWPVYLRSVLAFSALSVLFLYGLIRLQTHLLLSLGVPEMEAHQAWNTAVSFTTNTNWQSYSGESAMGHLVQMAGLAVQNFVSAAVGIAVVAALVRGFSRHRTDRVGNFWVDLTRISLRLLLPVSVLFALVLAANGVVQNFHGFEQVTTLSGGQQSIPGGPVASQEAIKLLGTNGGGFYNANSAHPFENPTGFTNLLEVFLLLVIPFALPRTFGRMVGDHRQGHAVVAVMGLFWAASAVLVTFFEHQHSGSALQAAGAAMEGKEQRFGVAASSLFAASTTLTSTGAVNSFHDSFTPFGGGLTVFDMMLGEIAPGGTGSGLYGMLVLAVVAVFVAGLMVGRTPEYLGKKLGGREMKFASLYILTTPTIVLVGTGCAIALPGERAGMLNDGAHGFSEVLYAFTSAANNNGSAFAGITVNTAWYDTALGLAMVFGRFLPVVFVLALAGSLARQRPVPASAGTLPTHGPLFVGLLSAVVLIVVGLTYFPALALGPIAEGLH